MSHKHKSKGSNGSNDPLPSLCATLSSLNSSTKSLSLHNNCTEFIFAHKPNCIINTADNNQQHTKRWDDSQLALELAEDEVVDSKERISKEKRFKSKILSSFRKWQLKISSWFFFFVIADFKWLLHYLSSPPTWHIPFYYYLFYVHRRSFKQKLIN